MNENEKVWTVIVSTAGVAVILSLLLTGLAQLAALISCGAAFPSPAVFSGISFVVSSDPGVFGAIGGCTVSAAAIWTTDAVVLGTLILAAATGLVMWSRWKQSDAYFRHDLLWRDGFAKRREVKKHLGERAVLGRAKSVRPTLKNAEAADVGWKIGASRGLDVWVSVEDSLVVEGPPRSGKGYRALIAAIIDWTGPLITTSTRNDNLTATLRMRARQGEVTVFDPQKLSGIRSTLRVSPTAQCEDALTAVQRANAIIAGTSLGKSDNNREWAAASADVFATLLHAAAISGGGTAALRRWGSNPSLARQAVEVLRSDGAPGWGDDLAAVLEGDEKLLGNMWFGVSAAVRPLAIPAILDTMSPGRGQEFDPEEFLAGSNTLYLIGTGAGAGAVGGFLGAVLDDVVEVARRKALASAGSRLDPPLGLILDEICNMFAWPSLPTILADGGGIGISTLVVLQSLSQAETAWSSGQADTIWSSAIAKLLLGGAGHVDHLRDVADILGQRRVSNRSRTYSDTGNSTSDSTQLEPVMTVDELRRMPVGMGLLTYRNRRGALLDMHGWTERADAREITAGRKATEQEQLAVFAEQYAQRRALRDSVAEANS